MAVGAGSIKRASKLSTEAATTKKKTAPVEQVKKTTARKPATKKAVAEKSTVNKETAEKPTMKKTAIEEQKKQNRTNQACRLTEEMPIYLL